MRLVRRYDLDERETDGAVHWNSMNPTLRKHFRRLEGNNSRTLIGCMNSRNVLLYIRAILGRTGGNLIAPELMGHVAIPYTRKEFLFHRGCSFDVHFNPHIRTDRWRTGNQSRKTDHLLHLSTHSGTIQMKKNLAMTSPSREKYTITTGGKLVRTPSTGSIQPDHKTKTTVLANQIPCHNYIQLCASRLYKAKELYLKDSRRLVPHRR